MSYACGGGSDLTLLSISGILSISLPFSFFFSAASVCVVGAVIFCVYVRVCVVILRSLSQLCRVELFLLAVRGRSAFGCVCVEMQMQALVH